MCSAVEEAKRKKKTTITAESITDALLITEYGDFIEEVNRKVQGTGRVQFSWLR